MPISIRSAEGKIPTCALCDKARQELSANTLGRTTMGARVIITTIPARLEAQHLVITVREGKKKRMIFLCKFTPLQSED